jgi:predicted nucleotidyltransferase
MTEFLTFFIKIVDCLNRVKIKYVIVGGLAAIIRGRARTTTDVDVIVENKPELLFIFLDCLERNGIDIMKDQVQIAMQEGSSISIFDTSSFARLDLKLARNIDENDVLNTSVSEMYEDVTIKVATIEEILYGKLLYMGPIDDLTDDEILNYTDAVDFLVLYDQYKDALDDDLLMNKIRRKHLESSYKRLIVLNQI